MQRGNKSLATPKQISLMNDYGNYSNKGPSMKCAWTVWKLELLSPNQNHNLGGFAVLRHSSDIPHVSGTVKVYMFHMFRPLVK